MPSQVAERFNAEVLRAIAILYDNHPKQMTLEFSDLSEMLPGQPHTREDEAYTQGTFKWLIDNGFINGTWHENICELSYGQLTALTWGILQRNDTNTSVQPLGEAVSQGAKLGPDQMSRIAELLMRRLMGD